MTNTELDALDTSDMDPLTFALREEVILLRGERNDLGEQFDALRLEFNALSHERDLLEQQLEAARREVVIVVSV